ncbi:HAD family hydrolase [Amphibacillus cookii]|uniref:HAD family hydrolase n=1 Tax=Amphibacillus cookii TaxID=767787 RepID=UPI00195ECF53|nr:HAD family hydrolase [Amphibacillus cookii]MBM7541620.1 putative hydrolase of the HAD superfamily [Amphibacillus cookii]
MTEVKHIIFDLDNTLFDFNACWEKAHRQIFFERGFDQFTTYDGFMTIYRKIDALLWEKLLAKQITLADLRRQRISLTLQTFNLDFTLLEGDAFYQDFFQLLLAELQPNQQVIDGLKELKVDYDLVILTNGLIEEQQAKVELLGLTDICPIYISEAIGYEKPDLQAFEHVMSANQFQPEQTLMVGDSLTNDIEPAEMLKMKTYHVTDDIISCLEKIQQGTFIT